MMVDQGLKVMVSLAEFLVALSVQRWRGLPLLLLLINVFTGYFIVGVVPGKGYS